MLLCLLSLRVHVRPYSLLRHHPVLPCALRHPPVPSCPRFPAHALPCTCLRPILCCYHLGPCALHAMPTSCVLRHHPVLPRALPRPPPPSCPALPGPRPLAHWSRVHLVLLHLGPYALRAMLLCLLSVRVWCSPSFWYSLLITDIAATKNGPLVEERNDWVAHSGSP